MFANLKLKTKLLSGFVAVLVLLAIVAGISVFAFTRADEGVTSYAQINGVAQRASDMQADLIAIRREVAVYTYTGDDKAYEKGVQTIRSLDGKLKEAIAGTQHPERLAQTKKAAAAVQGYAGGIARLHDIDKEQERLIQTMDPAGARMRTLVTELIDLAMSKNQHEVAATGGMAQEDLLLGRLSVNQMIGRRDFSKAADADKAFESYKKGLAEVESKAQLEENKKRISEARTLLPTYIDAYTKLSTLIKEAGELVGVKMAGQAQAAEEALDQVVSLAAKDQKQIETGTISMMANAVTTISVASLISLVAGLSLAWLLGSIIAKPVIGMTAAMGRLANKDWQTQVPALGQTDEIGAMAKAVQVFKESGIENERLAAEQAEGAGSEDQARPGARRRRQGLRDGCQQHRQDRVFGLDGAAIGGAVALGDRRGGEPPGDRGRGRVGTGLVERPDRRHGRRGAVLVDREIGRQVTQSTRIAGQAVDQANKTDARCRALPKAAQKSATSSS